MNLASKSNRRTFLKNGAKAITLPFLGSLLPTVVRATVENALAGNVPKRLLWMSMGHGHMEKHFYPEQTGSLADISLPPGWDSIKKNIGYTTLVSNFSNVQNKQPQPINGLHELVIPLKKGYMRRDNEFGYHVHVYDHKNRQFQGVLTMSGSILYELLHRGYRPMDFSEDKQEEIYTIPVIYGSNFAISISHISIILAIYLHQKFQDFFHNLDQLNH